MYIILLSVLKILDLWMTSQIIEECICVVVWSVSNLTTVSLP